MDITLAQRLSVVETKVEALENMGPKIEDIHSYVIAERAKDKQRASGYKLLAGVIAISGTLFEIFRK